MLKFAQKLKLVKIAIVIIVCHLIIGIIQEQIFRNTFLNKNDLKSHPERFTHAMAYAGVQCFVYSIIAKG
jgi:hypothetical protein